jgi:hypothetical protein
LLIALAECTSSETPPTNPVVEPVSSPVAVQPKLKVVPPFGMYCAVSRIRANFWGRRTLETAYVWRELTRAGGCPKQGGKTFVGFGLDDGSVDQELGPYGCLTTCTAMAAKDLNRDGLAELIVSDGMADGWAVRLFGVSYGPARRDTASATGPARQDMAPILVHGGDPLVEPGVLWVGASGSAGASRGARCTTLPSGRPGLVIRAMTGGPGIRRTAIVELDGVRATVIRAWNDRVGPRHHPSSGLHCAGTAVPAPLEVPLCGVGSVTGDLDGDGTADRLSLGSVFGSDRGCGYGHRKRLDIDLADDGVRDVSMYPHGCRDGCGLYGSADLNADGQLEIFLDEKQLSPPDWARIGIYELVGSDLQPVRFPGGSNRFSVRYSSWGYAGAYCTDANTLLLWHAKNVYSDAGLTLRMDEATFRFDPTTLSMTQLTGWTRSHPSDLPRDPRNGLQCGSLTAGPNR